MPANGTKTTQTKGQKATTTQTKRTGRAQVREGFTKARHGATTYVRQGTERAVDVPVGAALVAADRVNAIVEPWTGPQTRDEELKSIRQRVERELNKFERRGGTARRKASQRVRRTRNRVERELKQRRVSVETSVKENRTKAEEQLKKARSTFEERVTALV